MGGGECGLGHAGTDPSRCGGLRSDVDAHVDVLLLLLLTTDSPLTVCSMPPPAAICLFCEHV